MSAAPEISVVIAAYNHGRYIAQTIKSVLGQTFQDFEVIVLDDGSTDNTREVVASVPDERIRYVYQKNSGLPACGRNSGMRLARGRYIALLDGDDIWYEEKLAKCKKELDERRDVALVCHNEAIIYNGDVLRYSAYGPYVENMYLKLLLDGNCLHTSAIMMRREIFFDDGFMFAEDKYLFTIEDYEYWLRLSKKYRFYFLPDVLGAYRVTETGAFMSSGNSNTTNMLRLLDGHFEKMGTVSGGVRSKIRKRRSAVMCAAARPHHHKMDFTEARRWYKMAIAEYPMNYKAYIGYLAALAKLRILYR
jgi:teichuronic acid biosynthesis glycosyltransferase TuaG